MIHQVNFSLGHRLPGYTLKWCKRNRDDDDDDETEHVKVSAVR